LSQPSRQSEIPAAVTLEIIKRVESRVMRKNEIYFLMQLSFKLNKLYHMVVPWARAVS
jgi:hypothetical protein